MVAKLTSRMKKWLSHTAPNRSRGGGLGRCGQKSALQFGLDQYQTASLWFVRDRFGFYPKPHQPNLRRADRALAGLS